MNSSLFSDSQKIQRQRICLVFPGYIQKVKSLGTFACGSKIFEKLADDINICIVLENERSLKNYSLGQKLRNKRFIIFWGGLGKHSKQYWVEKKGCTNLCAPTLVNLINTNQSRFIFQTQRKH